MSKIYYHNVTKKIINESDLIDFMDKYDVDDECYKTIAGDATLIELTDKDIEFMLKEWNNWYIKQEEDN